MQGATARAQLQSMGIGQKQNIRTSEDGREAFPDIRCSSRETRALVNWCGLLATWVIERQWLVCSASICSEEACRNVRQMAPQVTLDERVVAVQTRRSEPQVIRHVLLRPAGSATLCDSSAKCRQALRKVETVEFLREVGLWGHYKGIIYHHIYGNHCLTVARATSAKSCVCPETQEVGVRVASDTIIK